MTNVGGLSAFALSPVSAVDAFAAWALSALSLLHAAAASSGRTIARIEGTTADGMRFMDHSLAATGPGCAGKRTRTAAPSTRELDVCRGAVERSTMLVNLNV